ncbi:Solute-binding protein [Alphaproteobacteria bacterium SO-S41]|nr:Solute-binding protein [Alphaproteobacteria bacterium SO-S41]
MTLTRRSLLTSVAAGMAASRLARADGPRLLTAADVHRDGYPTVEAVRWIGTELARETGGRLGIRLYHSGQLGNEDDSIGLVRFGGIDMCRVNIAALNNAFPETAILSLPYVFQSTDHMHRAIDGQVGADLLKVFGRRGMVGLAFYDAGARCFYNAHHPISTIGDLEGLKIRVPQSDIFLGMAGAMGANATPLTVSAVFSALQTRLIDGAENNWPTFETARHFEVAQHWAQTEHSYSPEALLISQRSLAILSADDQALLRDLARRSVPVMREKWVATETASRAKVLAAGVAVTEVDKADFRKAIEPMMAHYLRDERLAELFRRISAEA